MLLTCPCHEHDDIVHHIQLIVLVLADGQDLNCPSRVGEANDVLHESATNRGNAWGKALQSQQRCRSG